MRDLSTWPSETGCTGIENVASSGGPRHLAYAECRRNAVPRAVPISFILAAFPFPTHGHNQVPASGKKPCRVAPVSNRLEVTSKFGACYSNQSAIR
ncbi:hypothetical protein C0Q70_14979 [Pomacea canaliculata]|uniref:Uncharacterized protein n=1 Tax=Pomacea canaliculata TaxID=400727 RepID=A0A2T7NTM6_POMCA|nr:hypothetical protein C0Q70_14979 [Pomacea canaliculata]